MILCHSLLPAILTKLISFSTFLESSDFIELYQIRCHLLLLFAWNRVLLLLLLGLVSGRQRN